MNTWLLDLADAVETYKGYGRAEGGAFIISDAKGVVVMAGPGFTVRREGVEPRSRIEKPKTTPAQLAELIGLSVGKAVTPTPPTPSAPK